MHDILKLLSLAEEELHVVTEKAPPLQTAFREWDQCRLTLDIGSFLDGVAVITNIGLNTKESNLNGNRDRVRQPCMRHLAVLNGASKT